MNKIIFCHISFEPKTGVLSVIKNHLYEQNKNNIETYFIIFYSTLNYFNYINESNDFKNYNLKFIKVPIIYLPRLTLLFDCKLSIFLKELTSKNKIISLLFHDAHFSAVQIPFKIIAKHKIFVIFHGCPNGLVNSKGIKFIIHFFFNIFLYFRKICYISDCNNTSILVQKILFFKKNSFTTIYNGINSRNNIIQNNYFKNAIGFIGTIEERKNWQLAIDTTLEISKFNKNIKLLIAGSGKDLELMQSQIANNDCYFDYKGHVANLFNDFYPYIDILIITSKLEGIPIIILEAFSLGIPVISTGVGGIPEIIKNNQNGFIVESNKYEFAKKINYLYNNPVLYKKFSDNSKIYFSKYFTINISIKKYINLLFKNE